VRLALFVRVGALDFRVSPADFAVLIAFNTLVAFAGDFVRGGLPGYINFAALPLYLCQVPLILLACVIVAAILRRRDVILALATALFASDPFFELVAVAAAFAVPWLVPRVASGLGYGLLAWSFATMLRALLVFTGWRRWRTAGAASVLGAMFVSFVLWLAQTDLWVHSESSEEAEAAQPSIAEESLFHRQQRLLDDTLADLAPQRPGVVDLYFVGVAPYASQDVFVREMSAVRKLFDQRFGTAGRSIMLANSPATLADTPIATATSLRAVLEYLGEVMNAEEDVLFLYISTHGDQSHELAFELPPLELQQLTPTALARMLNDSGIKWKVLVVSACYSGGFVEPLKDANTVVITAADATSTSFGCENGRDFTEFGRAYFKDALTSTFSFIDAFETAKREVADKERAEHLPPSSPQIWIGSSIRAKLAALEQRLRMPH
jgi:hypothetical protein